MLFSGTCGRPWPHEREGPDGSKRRWEGRGAKRRRVQGTICFHLPKCFIIATYSIVIPHNNESGRILFTEQGEVLRGGEGGKGAREGKNLYTVNAKAKKESLFFIQRVQNPEIAGILLQNSARMGPECYDNGLLSPFTGRGDQCLYNMTMT